jgi:hypothetical protein
MAWRAARLSLSNASAMWVGFSSRSVISIIRVKPYTALVATPRDVERCGSAW